MKKRREPIPRDTRVKYLGREWCVGMVALVAGERFYWLVKGGAVVMVPWYAVEEANS